MPQKPPSPRSAAQEKRLAEALRANLRRRKEQDRGRAVPDEPATPEAGNTNPEA